GGVVESVLNLHLGARILLLHGGNEERLVLALPARRHVFRQEEDYQRSVSILRVADGYRRRRHGKPEGGSPQDSAAAPLEFSHVDLAPSVRPERFQAHRY